MSLSKPKHTACSPGHFGPHAWAFLESSAFCCRTNDKRKKFVAGLPYIGNMLGCDECSINFRKEISKINFSDYMQNNETMLKLIYDIHDSVNMRLGKVSPPFEDVLNYYISMEGDGYHADVPCEDCAVNHNTSYDTTEEVKYMHNLAMEKKKITSNKMTKTVGKNTIFKKRN